DNCEHLLDGMPVLLERLLAGSPRLSVLVTSRARLLVPFEWVFPVPGLCIAADDGAPGDAVELFLTRAAAAGSALTEADAARLAAGGRRRGRSRDRGRAGPARGPEPAGRRRGRARNALPRAGDRPPVRCRPAGPGGRG